VSKPAALSRLPSSVIPLVPFPSPFCARLTVAAGFALITASFHPSRAWFTPRRIRASFPPRRPCALRADGLLSSRRFLQRCRGNGARYPNADINLKPRTLVRLHYARWLHSGTVLYYVGYIINALPHTTYTRPVVLLFSCLSISYTFFCRRIAGSGTRAGEKIAAAPSGREGPSQVSSSRCVV